jgi:glycosyltransferase involved in cell wall biosynthesis
MRVLHVINSLGTGGAERSLSELLPVMSDAGIESSVACLYRNPAGVHPRVEADYRVDVVGRDRLPALRRIRALVRELRPELVHTTIFDADVIGRLASVGTGSRVLTSLVNTTYDGVRLADASINPMKLSAAKAVDRFTARYCTDHFHAISGAVRDSAVMHLGIRPDQITVIERGRDLSRLGRPSPSRRRRIRAELGLPDDSEVVLHIGRQERQKGLETLLQAVAQVSSKRPSVVLVQAGRNGLSSAALRTRADEPDLRGHVRFLGHRDDVGDLLAAADVFVFPSVYEGLGGSLIEAMAMGVPAVVSDVPALVDVVEHGRGALIVPTASASALAESVQRVLADDQLAGRLRMQAQEIFASRFTLDRSARKMIGLYKQMTADDYETLLGERRSTS